MPIENLLAEYQIKVDAILERYMLQYNDAYQNVKNFDTAKEFMDNHYDTYRKEVATAAMEIIHKSIVEGNGNDVANQIFKQNGFTIGKLFVEIMNVSLT